MGFKHTQPFIILKDSDEISAMSCMKKMFDVGKMHGIRTYINAADKTAGAFDSAKDK
jgi:hypothetical protein